MESNNVLTTEASCCSSCCLLLTPNITGVCLLGMLPMPCVQTPDAMWCYSSRWAATGKPFFCPNLIPDSFSFRHISASWKMRTMLYVGECWVFYDDFLRLLVMWVRGWGCRRFRWKSTMSNSPTSTLHTAFHASHCTVEKSATSGSLTAILACQSCLSLHTRLVVKNTWAATFLLL